MAESNAIRNIESAKPFSSKITKAYRARGWLGTVPIFPGKKEKPPEGFTGYEAPFPSDEDLFDWIGDPKYGAKANIGLRLGNPIAIDGKEYEVIGIDVDDYDDKGKRKEGGKQLEKLEREFGPLPPTWSSSSRNDGISGIRFFLVPIGFAFSGKAAQHIDIIQRKHRYAIVYPSWHPDGRQYVWRDPDGNVVARMADCPSVEELPFLPDAWLDFLTRGGIRDEGRPLDMDSTVEELRAWAKKTLPSPPADGSRDEHDGMCLQMRKNVGIWKKAIDEDPSSHDKIVSAHWNILRASVEGHTGWQAAVKVVEQYWARDVGERGKRGLDDIRGEIFRSKTTALRKIKAEIDNAAESGIQLVSSSCPCFDEDDTVGSGKAEPKTEPEEAAEPSDDGTDENDPDGGAVVPDVERSGSAEAPDKYEMNDDGNAEHLMDIYRGNLLWVPGLGQWISWNGDRWVGDNVAVGRHAFRTVKLRQLSYARQLHNRAKNIFETNGGDKKDPEWIAAKALANEWLKWSRSSGDNRRAEGALEAARSLPGVRIEAEQLDANPYVLGVANGVVELNPKTGPLFRDMRKEDFVTKHTEVPYIPYDQVAGHGKQMWEDYLAKFIPDRDLRHFFQKLMGYALLGHNPERLVVFLLGRTSTGKSTILNVILRALGDYAQPVKMSIFRDSKLNPELAQALPARIITSSEVSDRITLHADVLKNAAGFEPMTAELKGVNTIIRRVPAFLPIIGTNNPPSIPGADEATRDRLCVIPFNQYMPPEERDPTISHQLAEEAPIAVLSWMVEGNALYAREGLNPKEWPSACKSAQASFFSDLSHIGSFIREEIEFQPKDDSDKRWLLLNTELYSRYEMWCAENGIREKMDSLAVGKYLGSIGHSTVPRKIGRKSVRMYPGLRLKSDADETIGVRTTDGAESDRSNEKA